MSGCESSGSPAVKSSCYRWDSGAASHLCECGCESAFCTYKKKHIKTKMNIHNKCSLIRFWTFFNFIMTCVQVFRTLADFYLIYLFLLIFGLVLQADNGNLLCRVWFKKEKIHRLQMEDKKKSSIYYILFYRANSQQTSTQCPTTNTYYQKAN